MSSKQNPDKVRIRLKKANKKRLWRVVEMQLEEYKEAYFKEGYSGHAEHIHGILNGIVWGLQIFGATIEEVDNLASYISDRMTEIEEEVKKELGLNNVD